MHVFPALAFRPFPFFSHVCSLFLRLVLQARNRRFPCKRSPLSHPKFQQFRYQIASNPRRKNLTIS